jgi:hypothetical protein
MNITETMDLHQLEELSQENLSTQQIGLLRTLLNSTRYARLEEVPRAVWLSMLQQVRIQYLMA